MKWLLVTICTFAYLFVSTSVLLLHGKFTAVQNYFIQSVAVTRHAYLVLPLSLFTFSQATVTATVGDKNFTSVSTTEVPPTIQTVQYRTFRV